MKRRREVLRFVPAALAAGLLLGSLVGCPPPSQPPPDDTDQTDDQGNGDSPTPEIHVWQGGNEVYQDSEIDFGIVCENLCRQKAFEITNEGDDDLNLTGAADKVVTSGADAGLFSVVSQPSSPIAPHESSSFTIRFDATSEGAKAATISIASDDPSSTSYTFTVTGNGLVPPAKVPATGQSTSYATGDDGDLQMGVCWPVPRFTDNGDGTMTDALTGLMWEQNPLGSGTWHSAIVYATDLTLGDYTDWRLANANELESLVNAEEAAPAAWLDDQGFTTIQSGQYWVSTTASVLTAPMFAWRLRIDAGGALGRADMSISKYAWAVRDASSAGTIALPVTGMSFSYESEDDGDLQKGVAWPVPRFIDNEDGTVMDALTGLVWEQHLSTTTRTWADAITYANDLTLGGYEDWRLPNKNEMRSLVHYGSSNIANWLMNQGFYNVQDDLYWTSTTYAPNTDLAWYVILQYGHTEALVGKTASCYVWAVRGGE